MNSSGAAPVPTSVPSTTMKSGVMPVSSMAFTSARTSQVSHAQFAARRLADGKPPHLGIGRERAETHGRDVEGRGRIGPVAIGAADQKAAGLGAIEWCIHS